MRVTKIKKRLFAKFFRRTKRQRGRLLITTAAILSLGMVYSLGNSSEISPTAYTPLLDTIAKGESGGNYNAHFGSPANTKIRFTDMTVAEVLEWQDEHVAQGNVSGAVGKYQIIKPTLLELIDELAINLNERFDERLQDRLAIALLERRGSVAYVGKKLTREQFAANLAMEWAALPKVSGPNPHESYYASDGVNKSNISVDEVYSALDALQDSVK